MDERCVVHGEMLERVDKRTEEIREFLVGALDKPGLIGRVVAIENWKKKITTPATWAISSIFGCIIVVLIDIILKG